MSTKVPGGVWTRFVSSKYLKDIEGPGQEGENAQVIVALSVAACRALWASDDVTVGACCTATSASIATARGHGETQQGHRYLFHPRRVKLRR